MRVLIVHNRYLSRNIGGEDIVFENEEKALTAELGKENVFTYSVSNDNLKKIKLLTNIIYSRYHYKEVYKIIINNNIDIVHVHNYFPQLSMAIFKSAKNAGVKTIQTLHNYRWFCISGTLYRSNKGICEDCFRKKTIIPGILNSCYRDSYFQSLVASFAFFVYRKMNWEKYIDKYFVLTDFQKSKLIEMGLPDKKIILKPNFINKIEITKNHGDYYLYVGVLEDFKGIKEIISLWKTLDKSFKLIIIGNGSLKKYVKENISINISYHEKIEHKKVLSIIAGAKYLIQPSKCYETFGLTIIESMSVGTPVIGFDVGTRKDFIINNYNGYLISADRLKDTILLSRENKLYEQMSVNCINFAKKYSMKKIINQQIELYKTIINDNDEKNIN